MKRKWGNILLFGLMCISLSFISIKSDTTSSENKNDDFYSLSWAKIDSLEKIGLPKSVLDIVDQISLRAKKENNHQQYIKSTIFRIKFLNSIEEDYFITLIDDLKNEIELSEEPIKSIEYSLLGEMYMIYYSENRWDILNRTSSDELPQDINSWSEYDFFDQAGKAYKKSINYSEKLKKIPITNYKEILIDGKNTEGLRSTLFDFLAHRSIDYFIKEHNDPDFIIPFIPDVAYWDIGKEFVKQDISLLKGEKLHQSMKNFQELTQFHLTDNNIKALLDIEYKRLKYIRDNAWVKNSDSIYFASLKKFEKYYQQHENSFEIANYLWGKSISRNNDISLSENNDLRIKARDILIKLISNSKDGYLIDKSKFLLNEIESTELSFINERNIIPGQNYPIKIDYKNLDHCFVKVIKPETALLKKLKENNRNNELLKEVIQRSLVISEKKYDLPDLEDYYDHSVEVILDKLNIGEYVIVICSNDGFNPGEDQLVYQLVRATNLSCINRKKANGNLEFYVLDRSNGKPIPGVKATTFSRNYSRRRNTNSIEKTETFYTDEDGYFEIEVNNNNRGSFKIELDSGSDFFELNSNFNLYKTNPETIARKQTKIFTDRAIYRPGQTVYFKSISYSILNNDPEILINASLPIRFVDPNNQEINKLNLTTNDYGSAKGYFVIPYGILNGKLFYQV